MLVNNVSLLIFGGRKFDNETLMRHMLSNFQLQMNSKIIRVIHGVASGADSLGGYLAETWLNVEIDPYPALWKDITVPGAVIRSNQYGQYNALAGHQRNQRMIDEGVPDWGIGFAGGTGTKDMAKRLTAANIPIWNGGYL